MASKEIIRKFLLDIKNADVIDFVPTNKNRQTRFSIGLTAHDQDFILRNLSVSDYYNGPLPDHDINKNGDVWIFKYKYEKHLLYIKVKEKIVIDGRSIIKCLSIHIDNM